MKQLRARIPLDTDVYTLALERTAHLMETFDFVNVSFSGGKDSTATLNVALEVAKSDPRFERHLPLKVIFFDEEAIPYETEEYVRRIAARPDVDLQWYCLPIKHRNACARSSPWWWPWAPEAESSWCRPLPPEAITQLPGFPINPAQDRLTMPDCNGLWTPPELGNCGTLMGIRAAESLNRARAVSRRAHDNYIVPYQGKTARGNTWTAYPIYDWTTTDVWTAPARFGWDYNRAYDLMEMAGIPPTHQRCSPAFGEEPLQRFNVYAEAFPDVWAKMVDRVPGVGAAYRYSRTQLWGYGSHPPKPDTWRWEDYVRHFLHRFRPEDAGDIAHRIQVLLKDHYRKSGHAIVETARHPISGLSWSFLARVAVRGDFKGRRTSTATSAISHDEQGRPTARLWHKWADELNDIMAQGRYDELSAPVAAPSDAHSLIPDYAREARL